MNEKNSSSKNLPAKQETRIKIISQEDRDTYIRLGMFQSALHRKPNEKKIKQKKVGEDKDGNVKNSAYIPIGEIENMLDQDFFGLWGTENFTTKIVANEICGEIVLKVFHPVAQVWLERTGAGAVQIQMKAEWITENGKRVRKPTDITDITKKIQNTLEKDYPHLKTQCIRNAAASLGAKYGRNLNRGDVSDFNPLLTDKEAEKEQTHNDLKS